MRSKAIIKPIAWTERNVCLKQVGAANEGIEREHAAVRVPGEDAVLANGILGGELRDQLVGDKREKSIRGAIGKFAALKCRSQIATAVGVDDSCDDHRWQAAVAHEVIDNDRDLGEGPLAVEYDQQRHVRLHRAWDRDEDIPLLPENLRLHDLVFTDGEVEVLGREDRTHKAYGGDTDDRTAEMKTIHEQFPLFSGLNTTGSIEPQRAAGL